MKGEEEYWATKCKHAREATKVAEESPKEEERCQAQHMSSVRLYVLPVSRESESGRYKRAEYERDRVSLVLVRFPASLALGSESGVHTPYRRGIFLSTLLAENFSAKVWFIGCLLDFCTSHEATCMITLFFDHWSCR